MLGNGKEGVSKEVGDEDKAEAEGGSVVRGGGGVK